MTGGGGSRAGNASGMSEARRASVHHPLFARLYARLSAREEEQGQADHRRETLAGLTGRVIEVGAGNGLNFGHYPDSVTEILAVEPEAYLRRLAMRATEEADVPVRVLDGVAERLPAEDGEFDAGVASLVLCSVPHPDRALDELFRVIRPGGELRFYEHVVALRPGAARVQRAVDVVWPHLAGGCHASRDTNAAIREAGFVIESQRRFVFAPSPLVFPAAPRIMGKARRP